MKLSPTQYTNVLHDTLTLNNPSGSHISWCLAVTCTMMTHGRETHIVRALCFPPDLGNVLFKLLHTRLRDATHHYQGRSRASHLRDKTPVNRSLRPAPFSLFFLPLYHTATPNFKNTVICRNRVNLSNSGVSGGCGWGGGAGAGRRVMKGVLCDVWNRRPVTHPNLWPDFGRRVEQVKLGEICRWVCVANTNRGWWWSLTSRSSTSSVFMQFISYWCHSFHVTLACGWTCLPSSTIRRSAKHTIWKTYCNVLDINSDFQMTRPFIGIHIYTECNLELRKKIYILNLKYYPLPIPHQNHYAF